MMLRVLQILTLLLCLTMAVWVVATVPDFGTVALRKLTEGGTWTGLAVFVVAAAVLGYWPRDPDGRLVSPRSRRDR